jgi:hypothetical protein
MYWECRSKIDTAFWLIMNDYDICTLIEKYCCEDDRLIDSVKAKFFITDKDWEGILGLYGIIMIAIIAMENILSYSKGEQIRA